MLRCNVEVALGEGGTAQEHHGCHGQDLKPRCQDMGSRGCRAPGWNIDSHVDIPMWWRNFGPSWGIDLWQIYGFRGMNRATISKCSAALSMDNPTMMKHGRDHVHDSVVRKKNRFQIHPKFVISPQQSPAGSQPNFAQRRSPAVASPCCAPGRGTRRRETP